MTRSQFAVALVVVAVAGLMGGVVSDRLQGSPAVAQQREGQPGTYQVQGVPEMSVMPGMMGPMGAAASPHALFLLDTRIGTVWCYRWDPGANELRWSQLPSPPGLD
jgi:hypothetical protein